MDNAALPLTVPCPWAPEGLATPVYLTITSHPGVFQKALRGEAGIEQSAFLSLPRGDEDTVTSDVTGTSDGALNVAADRIYRQTRYIGFKSFKQRQLLKCSL